jgi:hypothetical protein
MRREERGYLIAYAADGISLHTFVEDALRARMLPSPRARASFKLTLPVITGNRPSAIDIADRDALYDLMERERLQ